MDIENPSDLGQYLTRPFRARVLSGGVSNRTVLVEFDAGERWVLKQALPKLRVPVDWFCPPERIEREALGMETLAAIAPPGVITPLVFCDPAQHLLAMQAVPEPHDNWKSLLLAGHVDQDHFRQFGTLLAAIRRAPHHAGLDDRGYFEALRLEPYYAYSASQVPEAAPFLHRLIEQTRATQSALVHGDFSPKNVLVHANRLVLLDHEVIHWGDPAFDVGFAMAHFLSKAFHLPAHREALLAGARTFLGRLPSVGEAELHHSLGCLLARVAGRSQLEYLSAAEKEEQRRRVVAWMLQPPPDLWTLIDQWNR